MIDVSFYMQIVMEYCGGGSVADLIGITEEPLDEPQIAYICRETLKVSIFLLTHMHTVLNCYLYCTTCLRCQFFFYNT